MPRRLEDADFRLLESNAALRDLEGDTPLFISQQPFDATYYFGESPQFAVGVSGGETELGPSSDPYWDNVVTLIDFEGTEHSVPYVSPPNLATVGPLYGEGWEPYGSQSVMVYDDDNRYWYKTENGTRAMFNGGALTLPGAGADTQFDWLCDGVTPWTIELSFNQTQLQPDDYYATGGDLLDSGGQELYLYLQGIYLTATSKYDLNSDTAWGGFEMGISSGDGLNYPIPLTETPDLVSLWTPNQFNKVMVTFDPVVGMTLFVDGIKELVIPPSGHPYQQQAPQYENRSLRVMGGWQNEDGQGTSSLMRGVIDNLRITKGVVRETGDYTPSSDAFSGPTTPFAGYTYQWYETTAGLLVGETGYSITLPNNDQTLDQTSYYCEVSDGLDTLTSDTATLTLAVRPVAEVTDVCVKATDGTWVSIMGPPGNGGEAGDIIDDDRIRDYLTWSSEKINAEIQKVAILLDEHASDKNNPHEVMHDQLTDVTPDQHHPQFHDLDSHTDVDLATNPLLEGQGLWYDEDTGLWKNRGILAEAFPTGLIDGGELNIGPSANDIEVIAGFGVLTDSYTDPLAPPTVTGIGWPQINTAITAAPPVAGSIVWFSLAPTTTPSVPPEVGGISVFVATLKQYSQPPSPPLARAELFLGVAVHNGVSWQEVSNPKVVNQAAETLREFVTTVSGLSRIISGGNVSEQNNFTLNQEEGVIWEQNRNWHNDKSDPNREVLPAAAPVNFRYVTRDFGDVETITDTFDPDRYDDGSGTPVNVPGNSNRSTIQRLYLDPANNYWVLWGQEVYRNFFEAEANLLAYTPEVPFLLQSSIFIGSAVIEKGKNDWDVNEAIFIPNGTSGAGQGGGGTAISEYINLTDTPATYALDKRKVATVNELELGLEHDYRSKYVDNYAEGSPYYPQEWVSNSTWIAIANTETTEPAFPQEVGELQALYPDSPPFSEASQVAQVRSGYGATFTQNGEVRSLKVWVPEISVDITYALVVINDPNGTTPSFTRIPLRNDQLSVGAWSTVSIGNQLYTVGSEVLVYLESLNRGTSNTVTGGWTYNGQDNVAPPATSGWNHNNAKTLVRIDKTDLDTTDRSSELLGIVSGSTLLFAETANPQNAQTYITLSPPTDQGTYFEYAVTLTNETGSLGAGVTTTFTGTVPVAQATKFVFEADKFLNYPAWADITSFLQYDDVDQPVDQNIGYGINFDFQQLSKSDDWDLIPIGGGDAGGGDFTPDVFTGAGSSGYVPDPVTENGRFLRDDGTWGSGGGGDKNTDGGFANSVYTAPQSIDGGSASG